jgi:hypothetical protein
MGPTKVLLATLCMAMGALAFADDPTPPATTSTTPPGSTDTSSAAADSTAADKAAADKAAADKAAADKAKSAATNAKTEPGGITADQVKTLRVAGYKANVQKDGQVVYCRSQPKPYSLLEEKVCGRPDDLLLSIANSKEQVKQMQRTNH